MDALANNHTMKPIHDQAFERAKSVSQINLSTSDSLTPVAITETAVVILPQDKDDRREIITKLTSKPWVIFIQEVWCAPAKLNDTRLPSEREDRTEAILIMLVIDGKQARTAQCGFRRSKDNTIFFEEWVSSETLPIKYVPIQGGTMEAIA